MKTKQETLTAEILPATIDGASLALVPTPTIHLKTADDIRLEMAKVYREMKSGKIALEDGTKLVYVLSQIGRMVETTDVQKRVEAMERVMGRRQPA